MEKIMKTSKILNTIAGVLRILLKVAAIVLAVAVVILLFVSPEHLIWSSVDYSLNLGNITLELVPGLAIPSRVTRLLIMGGLILTIPCCLFSALCLRYVQDILTPMSQGMPFARKVSDSLRKLSFITLIVGIITELGNVATSALIFAGFSPAFLFNGDYVSGYTVETVLDLNFLLPFAVLYLMSHVFRYGEQLQQLSDETL